MKMPMPPPPLLSVMEEISGDAKRLLDILSKTGEDEHYLAWDKLRYKEPPEGLTHEEWWTG